MKQEVVTTDTGQKSLSSKPHECPFCHKSITPDFLYAFVRQNDVEVFFSCPNPLCLHSFIGYYTYNRSQTNLAYQNKTSIGSLVTKQFDDEIVKISQQFVLIYNQAFAAEQQQLLEICGVGYRKALEFLIKDYAILNNPNDEANIKKVLLGKVIDKYVDDQRIKDAAKRAAWLGNDETHYIRIWEGKDLEDLKKLIDLTVHWIVMEALSKSFSFEMPG